MKLVRCLFAGAALVVLGMSTAWADRPHHSHAHVGVFVGVPVWPWYFPPPYYYPRPPVIIRQEAPPVYIEQAPSGTTADSYWYFCPGSKTYYPYVQDCPGGWVTETPHPPAK